MELPSRTTMRRLTVAGVALATVGATAYGVDAYIDHKTGQFMDRLDEVELDVNVRLEDNPNLVGREFGSGLADGFLHQIGEILVELTEYDG